MKRLRRWLLALRDSTVAEQAKEIAALDECRRELGRQLVDAESSLIRHKESLDRTIRVLHAVLQGIDLELDLNDATPAAVTHAVGVHLDRIKAAESRRAEEAESAAEDLRREIRDLGRSLETEQRAHEKTRHEAECIGRENRLLATIHETDVQRRAAERAIQVRREAEAEAAANELRGEERE